MESAAQRETAACEAGRSSGAAWKPAATPSSNSSDKTRGIGKEKWTCFSAVISMIEVSHIDVGHTQNRIIIH